MSLKIAVPATSKVDLGSFVPIPTFVDDGLIVVPKELPACV